MGMTSVVIIPNDLIHRIKDDPEFGARLYYDIAGFPPSRNEETSLGQYGRVISIGHTDDEQLVSVQGGRGAPLPYDEVEALWKYRRARDRKAKLAATVSEGTTS